MSPAHDLIRAIVDEDFVSAKELTSNLIYMAVSDKLDDAKRDVAANLFTDCQTCGDDDVSEGQMSANRYSGGTLPKGKPSTKAQRAKALKGNQSKIDANKNGKIDAEDFKILRASKKG